ncbi:HD-GYP domain-containing protein [Alkalilimnicola ehrlichii]|nr:HD domain-containing phosphohydrolase [Alkalilimnicola ehrlichii]
MVPILKNELEVGMIVPWAVFDGRGWLLLQAGATVASARQLEALVLRGVYRLEDNDGRRSYVESENADQRSESDFGSPFERLDSIIMRIPGIFRSALERQPQAGERLRRLAGDLRRLYAEYPDAMLGAVHLTHEYEYPVCHPVHCVFLCEMMAHAFGYDEARAESLAAAALSQNISMLRLQTRLHNQAKPLTEEQRHQVDEHPEQTVKLLRDIGVDDSVWLLAVAQHHERFDGKGYPYGLEGMAISQEAQIIAISDRYAALISSRGYRDGMTAKEGLRDIYLSQDKGYASAFTQRFIREIGVYPPGSFVKLANGEVGIVVKRGRSSLKPVVSSYIGPRGAPLPRPFRRDTGQLAYEVKGTCKPDLNYPVNLSKIWSV